MHGPQCDEVAGVSGNAKSTNNSPRKNIDPASRDAARRQLEGRSPLRRYASPEEVAALMLFLASDESRFVTGTVHMIDGGRTAM